MTKYIYIALGVGVVVLFGALRYQSSVIDELNITTKQQAQTIQQQEDANKALNIALQQERDAHQFASISLVFKSFVFRLPKCSSFNR